MKLNKRTGFWAASFAGALSVVAVLPANAQDAARPSTLPGGATSLTETFDDWQVLCGSQNGKSVCNISQTQTQQNTGQRVLDIRLNPIVAEGQVRGVLTLPFGLAFAQGVIPQVDEGAPAAALSFRTCLPAGCIVPVAIDKEALTAMRGGKVWALKTVSVQNQATPFSISLKGFGKAFDRAVSLSK